jgi:hypothetical protein
MGTGQRDASANRVPRTIQRAILVEHYDQEEAGVARRSTMTRPSALREEEEKMRTLVCVIAVASIASVCLLTADSTITLRIPARSMAARALAVRRDITENYIKGNKPFAFATIFHAVTMRPTGSDPASDAAAEAATTKLIARGALRFANGRFTNTGERLTDVPFIALVNGQQMRLAVTIPEQIRFKTTASASRLELTSERPLDIAVLDAVDNAPVGRYRVERLTADNSRVLLRLRNTVTTSNVLEVLLDLTQQDNAWSRSKNLTVLALELAWFRLQERIH